MTQKLLARIVAYPYLPNPRNVVADRKTRSGVNVSDEDERLASPNSLFWRGIWMLVF